MYMYLSWGIHKRFSYKERITGDKNEVEWSFRKANGEEQAISKASGKVVMTYSVQSILNGFFSACDLGYVR